MTPFLLSPLAPFESLSQRVAEAAAKYYGECAVEGIPPKEADAAAQESMAQFKNWWLRHRATSKPKSQQPILNVDTADEGMNATIKRQKSNKSFDELNVEKIRLTNMAAARHLLDNCKMHLLNALADTQGETSSPKFHKAVNDLVYARRMSNNFCNTDFDARKEPADGEPHAFDGVWLTVSKPNYSECLGQNADGEYMYTLGRLSFDMFRPTSLLCSIQGLFNPVFVTDHTPDVIPRNLRTDVQENKSTLRTYNIVVAFTIHSNDGKTRPLQGVMTNYGYVLPDPNTPNRFTVFFTGGLLEPNGETDVTEWKNIFGEAAPKRLLSERARLLAAKVLLGASVSDAMEDDGSMSYFLKRPIGGHGSTYMDVIYLDETLRVMKSQTDTYYVFSRVPPQHVQE
eukprot:CAMPEP_0172421434 /NCGR_PEP_ID=MMETSP1064-20121228/7676_1 /TAXON_ID=202472 /ORGANISM="Aulacoseira subarctica , Strain CCAP 1002/5" /LENGTH=398 /DNA_ID=CAMNT_0013161831 /DNA_START=149 /DNA_END=1345 /DNA_ORIENTATION=+